MKRDTISITTVDNVDLEFELAGMGSRFLAGAVDTFFIVSGVITISLFTGFFQLMFDTSVMGLTTILLIFVLLWGYHIFFEKLFQGQTPGKKMMGIQVLNQKGHYVSWKESLIRNLIRALDSLPTPLYFLGGIFIGVDDKQQRLGDMAAGTIVVKKCTFSGGRSFGAGWISRLEMGKMPQALRLQNGTLDPRRLELIVSFINRRGAIQQPERGALAWKIAEMLLELCGKDRDEFAVVEGRDQRSEALLEYIYASLQSANTRKGEEKLNLWKSFGKQVSSLLKSGVKGLRKLTASELEQLIYAYRQIVSDLARARSKNTDSGTLEEINSLAILGNQLLNSTYQKDYSTTKNSFFVNFPILVCRYYKFIAMSACLFFVPAAIAFFATQWHHELAYDLVAESFLDFNPWQKDNMHGMPPLTRPVTAASIISNNIQVTFFAFAFGITAGIGTAYVLIYNGIHLGAVFSWLLLQGHGRAFWGWIMPHAGTEILAIILAGGAGFILAEAVLRPGVLTIKESLKKSAGKAITIEIGCILMLLVAGLIEGFVSPSSIGFMTRILWLAVSCLVWGIYFGYVGLRVRT